MKLTKPQPWHFWSAESGLTGLLIFTLAYLFVVCALGDFSFGGLVGRVLFSLVIIAGVAATFRQRWVRFFVIVLAVIGLTLTWIAHIRQERSLIILSAIIGMLFLLLLLAFLIVQVLRAGTVTAHRLRGAVVVYLLIGGMWSFFYFVIALTIPDAFNWPKGLATDDWQAVQQVLTYFSFTHPDYCRLWRCHAGHPPDANPGHFRGPGRAALPGHHLDPVGVFISGLPQPSR